MRVLVVSGVGSIVASASAGGAITRAATPTKTANRFPKRRNSVTRSAAAIVFRLLAERIATVTSPPDPHSGADCESHRKHPRAIQVHAASLFLAPVPRLRTCSIVVAGNLVTHSWPP